jgi:hypothetical protein
MNRESATAEFKRNLLHQSDHGLAQMMKENRQFYSMIVAEINRRSRNRTEDRRLAEIQRLHRQQRNDKSRSQ